MEFFGLVDVVAFVVIEDVAADVVHVLRRMALEVADWVLLVRFVVDVVAAGVVVDHFDLLGRQHNNPDCFGSICPFFDPIDLGFVSHDNC